MHTETRTTKSPSGRDVVLSAVIAIPSARGAGSQTTFHLVPSTVSDGLRPRSLARSCSSASTRARGLRFGSGAVCSSIFKVPPREDGWKRAGGRGRRWRLGGSDVGEDRKRVGWKLTSSRRHSMSCDHGTSLLSESHPSRASEAALPGLQEVNWNHVRTVDSKNTPGTKISLTGMTLT
jgi:hypothetical protein